MATIGFDLPDIELLGYSNPRTLAADSTYPYAIYEARAVAGLEEIETNFLYLKSGCTIEDATQIARTLTRSKGSRWYLVTPESLNISAPTLRRIFGDDIPIHDHKTLVWEKLSRAFQGYVESLALVPSEKYYISPRSPNPSVGDLLGKRLLEYLRGSHHTDDGKLLVVCANAGVGKTTLARYLVHELRKRVDTYRTLPIFVEAQHWGRTRLDSIDRLWDVIDNSLRTFSRDLRFREDLFKYALQKGYLCFIFDGFDELCGRRTSNFVPSEVLQDISEIAEQSAGRVLITTRTLYWKAEIADPPANVSLYEVDAFNTQQAKGYFVKYFPDRPATQSRATGVYKKLVDGSFRPKESGGTRAQFVNLPLCVAMVAEYVRSGGKDLNVRNSRQLIEQLITDICQREVERKQLQTKARDQLGALQEIAVLDSPRINPEFELDMLEAAGIESSDVKKMIDHPLLEAIGDNRFRFSYDFLGPYLRSLYIADAFLHQGERLPAALIDLLKKEANGKGFILEHLVTLMGSGGLEDVGFAYRIISQKECDARSFLVHLALALISADPTVKTQCERTTRLFNALECSFDQDRTVRGLAITGTLDALDLSGVRFDSCRFHDMGFKRCRANNETVFAKSIFSGELLFEFESGEKLGWSEVTLEGCNVSFPASAVWEGIRDAGAVPWDEQVMDTLRVALGRFWYHGRPKKSIQVADWNKGILRHLSLARPMLDSMLRQGLLEPVMISGLSEGGLGLAKDAVADLQRFMDNQQLGGRIKLVYDELVDAGKR
jgi:hypothetical protein